MFLAVKRLTIYYCTGTQQQEANVQTDSAWQPTFMSNQDTSPTCCSKCRFIRGSESNESWLKWSGKWCVADRG